MDAVRDLHTETLLALARDGNAAALGTLLERHRAYLHLLARLEVGRRLQGKADPADLVQDAFAEAARQFAVFRGSTGRELTAWLRRILAGCLALFARRYLGTHARDVRLEQPLDDALDHSSRLFAAGVVDRGSSPSHGAGRREQAVLLADALDRLPPQYRDVIFLHGLEGLTFAESGARMGRSAVAAERLWSRALPQLRRAMEAGV
jgi:RNA polymerase sigma-70 factor, ECF subfamily